MVVPLAVSGSYTRSVLSREQLRKEIRKKYFALLQTLSCMDCGIADWRVLEFDHLRDKVDNIAHMVGKGTSWENILEEIAKCDPVCANCHRKRTAATQGWFKDLLRG